MVFSSYFYILCCLPLTHYVRLIMNMAVKLNLFITLPALTGLLFFFFFLTSVKTIMTIITVIRILSILYL